MDTQNHYSWCYSTVGYSFCVINVKIVMVTVMVTVSV